MASLLEAMLGGAEGPITDPAQLNAILTAAELSARMADVEPRSGGSALIPDSKFAAYFDGGLDDEERREVEALLVGSAENFQEATANVAYLDDVAGQLSSVPQNLIDAAIGALRQPQTAAVPQAEIIPLRSLPIRGKDLGAVALAESFELLAAASESGSHAILCCSQSGLWTLEVFDGRSERDQKSGRGYLLLTVHPDHSATYEGRAARVFVKFENEERVLAEEVVRNGEIYAEITLTGLDLRTKDAVNVVFGPAP